MADKILIRRGSLIDLPNLDDGELGYVEDRRTLYVGSTSDGNVLLSPILTNSDGYSLDGYLYPANDNKYGLGTNTNRWESINVGPGSLHIIAKNTDAGFATNFDFKFGIDSITGNLQIIGNNNILFEANPTTGVLIPGLNLDPVYLALDGYQTQINSNATINSIDSTGDGYIMFSTGVGRNIEGDNDLYWDRTNNVLVTNINTQNITLGGGDIQPYDWSSNTAFKGFKFDSTNGHFAVVSAGNGTALIWDTIDNSAGIWQALNFTSTNGNFNLSFSSLALASNLPLAWQNGTSIFSGAADVGLSRISAGVLGVGNGTAGDTSGALHVSSITTSGADNYIGKTIIYDSDGNMEINVLGTGDRISYIDFHSDDTNIDYGTRLIRTAGVNGDFYFQMGGTGNFVFFSSIYIGASLTVANANGGILEAPFGTTGVYGSGATSGGTGVQGQGTGTSPGGFFSGGGSGGVGIVGVGQLGEKGVSGQGGSSDGTGVYGNGGGTNGNGGQFSGAGNGIGAIASASGSGSALYAQSTGSGTAVLADSSDGYGYAIVASADTTSPVRSALRLIPQDTAPSSAQEGDIYANSIDHKLYFFNGTIWNALF